MLPAQSSRSDRRYRSCRKAPARARNCRARRTRDACRLGGQNHVRSDSLRNSQLRSIGVARRARARLLSTSPHRYLTMSWFTVPNALGVLRLLLTPFIVIRILERDSNSALWLLALAGLTDAL